MNINEKQKMIICESLHVVGDYIARNSNLDKKIKKVFLNKLDNIANKALSIKEHHPLMDMEYEMLTRDEIQKIKELHKIIEKEESMMEFESWLCDYEQNLTSDRDSGEYLSMIF